jgi:hypothetical protein
MPHAELKYSTDLEIDAAAILADVEATIQAHDAGSGMCKGRAYPAAVFHHTHLIFEVSMLPKAHRDAAFMAALLKDLEACIKSHINAPCAFSLSVSFSANTYVTNMHPG